MRYLLSYYYLSRVSTLTQMPGMLGGVRSLMESSCFNLVDACQVGATFSVG